MVALPTHRGGTIRDLTNAEDQVDEPDPRRILLMRSAQNCQDTWVLLSAADAGVRVNTRPLLLGACVLEDKDELTTAVGPTWFFSTETVACVEPLPETTTPAVCPRCRQEIAPREPIVRCPGCGVAHHQSQERGLPCWTGDPDAPFETCAQCDAPATLGGDFRWSPNDL
jgi:hypothetical protein